MSEDIRRMIDKVKNFKQFNHLNENINDERYFHITPDVNIPSIKISGLKKGKGEGGSGVYLTKTIEDALKWKDILEYGESEEYEIRGVQNWYIIEVHNLDISKMESGDTYEDDESHFMEYIYKDNIPLKNIKSFNVL